MIWYTTRWSHQMETFSAVLALCEGNPPVTGGFPSQRPVTLSFDVFLHLRLNKRLNEQSRRHWFETPSRLLWRHWHRLVNTEVTLYEVVLEHSLNMCDIHICNHIWFKDTHTNNREKCIRICIVALCDTYVAQFHYEELPSSCWILLIWFRNSSPPGRNGRQFDRRHFQLHFLERKW